MSDLQITQADLLIKIGLLTVENDILRQKLAALEAQPPADPASREKERH